MWCGRTGNWFAYQHFGVEPDVMTLAKTICSGIAAGAMLTRPESAPSLRPGMHAATFGGNPVAAAAGIATIKMVEEEGLLEKATQMGAHFRTRLEEMRREIDIIRDIRIVGAMIGIELQVEGAKFVQGCMEEKLLINCTQGNVIRLLPPVNSTFSAIVIFSYSFYVCVFFKSVVEQCWKSPRLQQPELRPLVSSPFSYHQHS